MVEDLEPKCEKCGTTEDVYHVHLQPMDEDKHYWFLCEKCLDEFFRKGNFRACTIYRKIT